MKIRYLIEKSQRKALAHKIGELTGMEVKYLGVPSCTYQIGDFTLSKDAVLSFCDRTDSKCVELLSNELEQAGFHAEEVPETLTVQMPRETISEDALLNLQRIVVNKQNLLCHAFGTESLSIVETEQTFDFPWFTIHETGDGDAYAKFITCLCAFAKARKRVNNKPDTGDNEKYAFRCFLLRLGMIGDAYKATRKVLLRNLSGSAAFRHGKEGADDVISE